MAYAVLRSNVATKTIDLWKGQAEAMEERYVTERQFRHECEEDLEDALDRLDKVEEAQRVLIKILAKNIDQEALKTLHALGVDQANRPVRRKKRRDPDPGGNRQND